MRQSLGWAVVTTGFLLVGCYHATIETGLLASPEVIEKAWASGWVYGLVPPKTVETASKCPNGVAKIETQLSFLNQLVAALTAGIYTPMAIKVTCAARGSASLTPRSPTIKVGLDATMGQKQQALTDAARLALSIDAPVLVLF